MKAVVAHRHAAETRIHQRVQSALRAFRCPPPEPIRRDAGAQAETSALPDEGKCHLLTKHGLAARHDDRADSRSRGFLDGLQESFLGRPLTTRMRAALDAAV